MNDELEIPQNFSKVIVGLVIGVIVLGGVVYLGYNMSKKNGQTVLPNGFPVATQAPQPATLANMDCSKTTKADPANPWPYYIKCDPFKVSSDAKWKTFTDDRNGFSFDIPDTLKTAPYPNGMGIEYYELQPNVNLLYSLDLESSRSGEFKNMDLANYPANYWRQFSGLTGVREVTQLTNSKNVKYAKAVYVNIANETPSVEVFFEFPNRKGDFVHFGSGALSQEVFNTIIESFKFTK